MGGVNRGEHRKLAIYRLILSKCGPEKAFYRNGVVPVANIDSLEICGRTRSQRFCALRGHSMGRMLVRTVGIARPMGLPSPSTSSDCP
jgi:hypothetical protein